MFISTHLPPPVMIERTASVALVTHILCCTWAMCFSAAASSENDQGSMNLASNTAPVPSTIPSRVAAIHRMTNPALDVLDGLAGSPLEPMPIDRLGSCPQLND